MAFSKTLTVSLLLIALLLLHPAGAQASTGNDEAISLASETTIDCGIACEGRCKLSKRPHLCNRACGSCCAKCSCVPPGTYGNYELCPCYANLTTRKQIRKCP